ncbi:hypothetical protein OAB00_01635 [Akkermansiaceae bacterium]|nr:hypothetical protein [Akkermansiaceae bacterium]
MKADWKFDDEPNTACFTSSDILAGGQITSVSHDFEGDWVFLNSRGAEASDAKIVGLQEMLNIDPSLEEFHDLPFAWRAVRTDALSPWRREKANAFPDFTEDGYYLEDAVWISQYRDDITPPSPEVIDELREGDCVKLIFRFAAENEERVDGQVERMWVQLKGMDEFGHLVGEIANEAQHKEAKLGDIISFHPLHVAAVET